MQLFCNAAGSMSLADESKNLQLAVTESIDRKLDARSAGSNKLLQHLIGHSITQIDFSAQNSTKRHQHILSRLLLHNIASSAGAQSSRGVDGFVMDGEHQHRQTGYSGLQMLDQFDAIGALQRNIRNGNVRLHDLHRFERRIDVLGCAANKQVRLAIDQFGQSFPHDRMVVDYKDRALLLDRVFSLARQECLPFTIHRERADDHRSPARMFLNIQRCTDHICAVVHCAYPHALFVLKPICETQPIVSDTEEDFVPAVRKLYDNFPGLTMFDGIRHGLLSDSIKMGGQITVANQNILINFETTSDIKKLFDFRS